MDLLCSALTRREVVCGRELDQHINSNPDKEKQLVGCAHTNITCFLCNKLHPRHVTRQHQISLCLKRPFTCIMCMAYKSTYEDVVNNHHPVCKCRPVECPNSCGADNLQHQHLEQHVSSQCPLTYLECEFSDAGCDAKVYRKDLTSHLTDNLVTHMSLLAMENRKLKQQLQKQGEKASEENRKLEMQLQKQEEIASAATKRLEQHLEMQEQVAGTQHKDLVQQLKKQEERAFLENRVLRESFKIQLQQQLILEKCESPLKLVLPIDLLCPSKVRQVGGCWSSVPFYGHTGSCKLQVKVLSKPFYSREGYNVFVVSLGHTQALPKLKATIHRMNQINGTTIDTFQKRIVKEVPKPCTVPPDFYCLVENDYIQLRIIKIARMK